MSDKIKKGNPQDISGKDYGPTYDPFTYGFNTPVGYKKMNTDKYVSSGSFNSRTEELDLTVEGSETVKIKLDGVGGKDERVISGSSIITEEEQTLKLSIGDDIGELSEVDIDLSGLSETYCSKSELDEKFRWGEF